MRPLEWLVLIALVAVLPVAFVPSAARRRWLVAAAALAAAAAALHLGVEGWRPQMAPLYALVAAVVIAGLVVERARGRGGPAWRAVAATALAAAVVVGGGVLAGWLLPAVALPAPTGPHAVGIVDRELIDEARGRRLMASVWYPADDGGAPAPLTRHPDAVMAALGNLTGLPGLVFHHLRYVALDAAEGAPVQDGLAPFPVLVFSHGMVGMRLQNAPTLQDLASWGYVVVAVDHTDAAAVTVFPDGEERFYDPERFGIAAGAAPSRTEVEERMFPVWVADQRAVYDALATWAADDPLLAGALDLSRIGSFGHSFGGATALEVCRVDDRCRAAADLDGGLYGGIARQPAVRPLLVMSSAASAENPEAVADWTSLVARATAGATWLELPDSSHLSFTFIELLSPLLVPPGYDPRHGLRVVADQLRAFFDAELRGVEPPLPGLASGSAEVRWRAGARPR